MEKIAYEIEMLLQEKLSCYRQLGLVLDSEKELITAMNLDGLWQTTTSKRQLAGQIERLRQNILDLLKNGFMDMDMDPRTFSLAYMIQTLPLADRIKTGLRRVARQINTVKDQVVAQARFNQVQVRKYLSVADDIMSVIGDNSSLAQYTGAGIMPGQKKHNCIFKAEV